MKILSVLMVIMVMVPIAGAAEVTLAWDASASDGVDAYRIYSRDFESPEYDAILWEGPRLTCTVTVPDGREVAFVATAVDYGYLDLEGNALLAESGYSNEAVYTPGTIPIEPPTGFSIVGAILAGLSIIAIPCVWLWRKTFGRLKK